jgi:uncharacterized protein (TIGR00251 family)
MGGQRPWRRNGDDVLLRLYLTPKSSRDQLGEVFEHPSGCVIKASVRALPDKGEANRALLKLLGKYLKRPKTSLVIAAGSQSRIKTVRISGKATEIIKLLEKRFFSTGTA